MSVLTSLSYVRSETNIPFTGSIPSEIAGRPAIVAADPGLISYAPWLLNETPEPTMFALIGAGLIGVALLRRKKNRPSAHIQSPLSRQNFGTGIRSGLN